MSGDGVRHSRGSYQGTPLAAGDGSFQLDAASQSSSNDLPEQLTSGSGEGYTDRDELELELLQSQLSRTAATAPAVAQIGGGVAGQRNEQDRAQVEHMQQQISNLTASVEQMTALFAATMQNRPLQLQPPAPMQAPPVQPLATPIQHPHQASATPQSQPHPQRHADSSSMRQQVMRQLYTTV